MFSDEIESGAQIFHLLCDVVSLSCAEIVRNDLGGGPRIPHQLRDLFRNDGRLFTRVAIARSTVHAFYEDYIARFKPLVPRS